MNIKLDEKFFITSDDNNFVLNEIKDGKTEGTTYSRVVGYYGEIEHLFQAYLTQTLRQSDAYSINELLVELMTTRQYIKSLLGMNNLWQK